MSEGFSYNYSAGRQAEIDKIKEKYLPTKISEQESKLERLRKLDASCEGAAQAAGIGLGVIGTLIFGLGMSLFLSFGYYIFGIVVGVVGIPLIIMAKPVYDKVLKAKREKAAPEIIRLSEELERGE